MTKFTLPFALFVLSAFAVGIVGCSKEPAQPPAEPVAVVEEEVIEEVEVPAAAPADSGATTDGGAATDAAPATENAEVAAALASLSEADRTAALAQKTCPVSDEPLGAMGAPIKVTVDGRDVFICCEGCRKSLEEDPAKYLAKLDAKK